MIVILIFLVYIGFIIMGGAALNATEIQDDLENGYTRIRTPRRARRATAGNYLLAAVPLVGQIAALVITCCYTDGFVLKIPVGEK